MKRRLKKKYKVLFTFLAVILAVCVFIAAGNRPKEPEIEYGIFLPVGNGIETDKPYIEAKVLYAIDGDTLFVKTIDYPDGIKVRYIGIDCPESVCEDESKNTEEGRVAAKRNEEIIRSCGNIVYLEQDKELFDKYDRLLAYVYVKGFEGNPEYTMIEKILLSEGQGKTLFVEPNVKHQAELLAVEGGI